MICSNCKQEILDKAKFCGYCGKEVKDEKIETKVINNNENKGLKGKILIPIFILIIGIGLIYNKFNIDDNKKEDDIKNKIGNISDNNQNDSIKSNRDNIVKYVELFDDWAYFSGGYLYIIENGLIKICLDGELIYEEYEINKGTWYGEENEDLLNIDVSYWIEGDTTYSVIDSLVEYIVELDNWSELSADENEYCLYINECMGLRYFVDSNELVIFMLIDGVEPYDIYSYNLETREESIFTEINEDRDYINREISLIISQFIPSI